MNREDFLMTFAKVLGGVAMVIAAMVIASSIPDIKRYIRISTM
jgi:hypothetical protein